jgi:hypothetical protein
MHTYVGRAAGGDRPNPTGHATIATVAPFRHRERQACPSLTVRCAAALWNRDPYVRVGGGWAATANSTRIGPSCLPDAQLATACRDHQEK